MAASLPGLVPRDALSVCAAGAHVQGADGNIKLVTGDAARGDRHSLRSSSSSTSRLISVTLQNGKLGIQSDVLCITSVDVDGAAAQFNHDNVYDKIVAGEKIIEVDGYPVFSKKDVRERLLAAGDSVQLRLEQPAALCVPRAPAPAASAASAAGDAVDGAAQRAAIDLEPPDAAALQDQPRRSAWADLASESSELGSDDVRGIEAACGEFETCLQIVEQDIDMQFNGKALRDRREFRSSLSFTANVSIRSAMREFDVCIGQYGISLTLMSSFVLMVRPLAMLGFDERAACAESFLAQWGEFKALWTRAWQQQKESIKWLFPQ